MRLNPKQASPTKRQMNKKKNLISIKFLRRRKESKAKEITDINSKDRSINLIWEFNLISNKILIKYHIKNILSIDMLLKIKNIVKKYK